MPEAQSNNGIEWMDEMGGRGELSSSLGRSVAVGQVGPRGSSRGVGRRDSKGKARQASNQQSRSGDGRVKDGALD